MECWNTTGWHVGMPGYWNNDQRILASPVNTLAGKVETGNQEIRVSL